MDTIVFIAGAPTFFARGAICPPAFFPASAVGDDLYSHAIASAGTIVNKSDSDESGNLNTATESVCPKGWTLPSKTQIDGQRNINSFSPVLGGYYVNSTLDRESTHGYWWGSTAYSGAWRYYLGYDGNLYTSIYGYRHDGHYIRCVSEEKTVTDLTYLQDMTGGIANKIAGFFISLSRIL